MTERRKKMMDIYWCARTEEQEKVMHGYELSPSMDMHEYPAHIQILMLKDVQDALADMIGDLQVLADIEANIDRRIEEAAEQGAIEAFEKAKEIEQEAKKLTDNVIGLAMEKIRRSKG